MTRTQAENASRTVLNVVMALMVPTIPLAFMAGVHFGGQSERLENLEKRRAGLETRMVVTETSVSEIKEKVKYVRNKVQTNGTAINKILKIVEKNDSLD